MEFYSHPNGILFSPINPKSLDFTAISEACNQESNQESNQAINQGNQGAGGSIDLSTILLTGNQTVKL